MKLPHPSSSARALLVAGAVGAVALAAASGGELSTRALRVIAVLALLAMVAHAVRPAASPERPGANDLAVRHRHSLGRETGVAIVSAGGRRILVGFGPQGVTHLAELTRDAGSEPS